MEKGGCVVQHMCNNWLCATFSMCNTCALIGYLSDSSYHGGIFSSARMFPCIPRLLTLERSPLYQTQYVQRIDPSVVSTI